MAIDKPFSQKIELFWFFTDEQGFFWRSQSDQMQQNKTSKK
jgi:hypothetical protein